MSEWWESAPLADEKPGGGDWWASAPLAEPEPSGPRAGNFAARDPRRLDLASEQTATAGMPFGAVNLIGDTMPEAGTVLDRDPVGIRPDFTMRGASAASNAVESAVQQREAQQQRERDFGAVSPIKGPEPSVESIARGLYTDAVAGGKSARAGISQMTADLTGSTYQAQQARKERGQADLMTAVNTPEFESDTARGIYGGLSSTVRQLPSIAAAVVTRNPAVALGGMVAPMVPDEYGKFRARGATPSEALPAAVAMAATEYITEKMPMGLLVDKFGKVGAGKLLAGLLVREVPGEQVATVVQDAIDTAVANPDKTWSSYFAERPGAAYQTLLATVTQTGLMTGASALASRGQPEPAPISSAEEMARARGFLAVPRIEDQPTTPVVPPIPARADTRPPVIPTAQQGALASQAVDNIARLVAPEGASDASPAMEPGREPAGSAGAGSAVDAGSLGDRGLLPADPGGRVADAAPAPVPRSEPPVAVGDAGAQPGPVATLNESGTVTIKGDPNAIIDMLRAGGVVSILPARNGVMVGANQAEAALKLVQSNVQNNAQPADQAQAPSPEAATPARGGTFGWEVATGQPAPRTAPIVEAAGVRTEGVSNAQRQSQSPAPAGEPAAAIEPAIDRVEPAPVPGEAGSPQAGAGGIAGGAEPVGITDQQKPDPYAAPQSRYQVESPQVGTNLEKMGHHLKASQIAGRKEGEQAKQASRAHYEKAMEFQTLDLAEKKAEATKAKRAATVAAKQGQAEVADLQTAYDTAKTNLDALGEEPRKPSGERQFFGAKGREGAAPALVAKYDADVKAHASWRRKYSTLKKAEVEASNALFHANRSKVRETITPAQDEAFGSNDAGEQIDREAAGQTLTRPTAPEQRKDTTGDLIGTTAEEALAARRAAEEARARPADDSTVGMFSRSADTRVAYEARIDALIAGEPANRIGVRILDSSDVLRLLGFADHPVVLKESKVAGGRFDHHLTAEHWKKIPEWLDNPAAVFESDTSPGRMVFIAPELVNGAPVVIVVEPDASVGATSVHLMVNAYDKDSGKVPFQRWARDGLMQYVDQKKIPAILATSGLQLPGVLQEARGLGRSVKTHADLVKFRASPSFRRGTTESPGLTLTQFDAAMAAAFGFRVAERLRDKGVVIPLADQSSLPGHVVPFVRDDDIVYGFYGPRTDRTYAVLENLSTDMVKGLALHEVGVHYGFEQMLGKQKYAQVIDRIKVMGRMRSKAVLAARDSAQRNSANPSQIPEETLAYLVQNHPEMTLVQEVIAKIKAFLFREFGIGASKLTEADIHMLARAAVEHSSRTEPGQRRPDFVKPEFSKEAEQVKSATGNLGTFSPENPDIRFSRGQEDGGFDLPEFGKLAAGIESIQDRYNRWKQAVQAVREQGGIVDDTNDFYAAEERYWGIVANQADDFKDEVGAFVKAVRADGLGLDEVARYAYALHAPERNAQIARINPKMPEGGSGMTDAQAQEIIDQADADGMRQMLDRHAQTLHDWTAGTRRVLADNGLISPEELADWEGAYENYVPLRGVAIAEAKSGRGTGQGFDVRGQESQRALGRRSEAQDIIEYIVQDRTRALVRAGKNEVLRHFAKFVLDNPDPSLWEINKVERRRGLTKGADGEPVVTEHEAVDKLPEHTVAVKDGGNTIYIRIHDEKLLEQLKNLNADEVGKFLGAILWANRMMARAYTTLSPVFALLTNPARDIQAGAVNMVGSRGFKAAGKLVLGVPMAWGPAFKAEVMGKPSAMYREFQMTGGKTGFLDYKDIDSQVKELQRLVAQADITWNPATWVTGHGWQTPFVAGSKAARNLLSGIEAITGVMENATRFAAYKAAREAGERPAAAASLAKNLTVNFNRKGTMTSALSAWILFFNPAIQGSARMIEALRSPKVMATVGLAMTGVALLALANAGAGDDDDGVAWWDKIPDEVKERNLVFVLSPMSKEGEQIPGSKTGRYLKIPMSYGYNIFASMANAVVDDMRHQQDPRRGKSHGKAAAAVAKAFLGAWVPVAEFGASLDNSAALALSAVPPVLKPVAQNVLNINAFGRKMYRSDAQAQDLPDAQNFGMADRGTLGQKAATALNDATGGSKYREGAVSVTPASMNNALRGYGGAPVTFVTDLVNVFLRNGVERDEPEWYRAPFVKQLYGRIDGVADQALAYQHLDDIQKKSLAFERAMKAGDRSEAGAALQDGGPLAMLGDAARQTQKRLSDIRKAEAAIIDDAKMSDMEKTMRLRSLDLQARKAAQDLSRVIGREIGRGEQIKAFANRLQARDPAK